MFEATCQFLKFRESSFKGKDGTEIAMVYVNLLTSEGEVIEVTAQKDLAPVLRQYNNGDKIKITANVYQKK